MQRTAKSSRASWRPEAIRPESIVGDYARRWRVENGIAEAVKFFHLNAMSSPILTKVHFDVALTMVADTLYTMLAHKLRGFEDCDAPKLYRHFVQGKGVVSVAGSKVTVSFPRRDHNPILRGVPWDNLPAALLTPSGAVMARPKSNNSTATRIERRIWKAPADTVFYAGQFLDLDTRAGVDQALSRLVRAGTLRRLARGLYHRPRQHPVLGAVAPSVEAVARALRARDRVRLQPFGGYAANLLRMSDQVPMRVVFLTDGKPRKVRFGRQTIELRRASPRMMAAAGRTTGLVIAGLRFIGRANVSSERVAHLRQLLSPKDRRRLIQDILLAPAWMHPFFRSIAKEDASS